MTAFQFSFKKKIKKTPVNTNDIPIMGFAQICQKV